MRRNEAVRSSIGVRQNRLLSGYLGGRFGVLEGFRPQHEPLEADHHDEEDTGEDGRFDEIEHAGERDDSEDERGKGADETCDEESESRIHESLYDDLRY